MASLTFTADALQPRYIIGFTLICRNNHSTSRVSRLVVLALIATRVAISESIANEVALPSSFYPVYIYPRSEILKNRARSKEIAGIYGCLPGLSSLSVTARYLMLRTTLPRIVYPAAL